jgi:hypothetical protein
MKTTVFLIFMLILVSCGKPSALVFDAPPEHVDFTLLSSILVANKCVGCHKGFAEEKRLSRFINGNDPDTSRLFLAAKEGKMPPKGPALTSKELELIRVYISSIVVKPEETISPEKVDFKVLSEVVFDKCIVCHKGWTAEEKFAKHIKGNNPDQSRLYLSVVEGKMPKNGPKMSQKEQEIIRNYILNRK